MTFYETLTPYYDEIFPTNPKTLNFLSEHFKKGGRILDVGAGTGNMALSLAQQGFQLTATEPEERMAEQIQQKANAQHITMTVSTKAMQQLSEFAEMYDGIYCIGNTLVHLNNADEISAFIEQVYNKLNENSVFIFQIVNFDKVLFKKDFHFPVMEKENFTFERKYDLSEDNHILFTTTLTADNESLTNTIPLYPATSKELFTILDQCGFEEIKAYGNFEYKEYSIETPALIVTAKKGRA